MCIKNIEWVYFCNISLSFTCATQNIEIHHHFCSKDFHSVDIYGYYFSLVLTSANHFFFFKKYSSSKELMKGVYLVNTIYNDYSLVLL